MVPDEIVLPASAAAFSNVLRVFSKCYAQLLEPLERGAIYFDDDVIPACLRLMGIIATRAAGLNEDDRTVYLRVVSEYAPTLCRQIVTNAERRNPPVLKGADLPDECFGVECGGGG